MADTTIPQTPNDQKMVPEKDLLAIKAGAEKKEAELLTQVAESNRIKEETHNNLLAMQAAKEQLEEQLKEGTATKAQVVDLQAKLKTAEESVSGLTIKLLDQRRVAIASSYGVDVSTLKGKTQDQLDSLEEALKLVGKKATPANLDISGGGKGAAMPLSPLDQCREEIAELRSRK